MAVGPLNVCTCGLGDHHPHHESRDYLCPASPFYRESPHAHLVPGTKCPTCDRKIGHPRKESSPTSKTFAYRVPLDEAEAHADTLDQVQRYLGVAEQPFSAFKSLALAFALVLQDENLRGLGRRAA